MQTEHWVGKSFSQVYDAVFEVTADPFRTNSPTFGGIAGDLWLPVVGIILITIFIVAAASR